MSQLEAGGVFIEATRPDELSQVFGVVSPDLVVQFGAEQAEEVATFLAAGPDARRVRLVLVVDREDVQALRKTNRAVVASILSNDMPEKTLIDRIVLLAQKSAHGAQAAKLSLAPARPQIALNPSPAPTLSRSVVPRPLTSRAPLAPRGESRQPTLDGPVGLAPRLVPLPSLASPAPAPPLAPSPGAANTPLSAVKPPPLPNPPPSSDRFRTPATPAQRLALVDDDVTRGDALAAALRVLGFAVHLCPSDPARTRWAVLRKFAPDVIVTDGSAAPQLVWVELLRADAHLKRAEFITAPYRRLYEDNTGALNLQPLLARLGGQPDSLAAPEHLVSENDVDLDEEERDEDEDRPTLVVDEAVKNVHLAVTTQNARSPFSRDATPLSEPTVLVEKAVAPAGDVLDFQGLASHNQSSPPPLPPAIDGVVDSAVSATGVTMTEPPHAKKKSRALPVAVILGVLAAGGGYLYSQNPARVTAPVVVAGVPRASVPSTTPGAAAPSPLPPSGSAVSPQPSQTVGQGMEPAVGADLWKAPDDRTVPQCEQLVPETGELRKGDVAQSGLFWDKARSALVLGDFRLAQAHLCRAVFVYGQSLAVEALAESYLGQHAPSLAKRWIEVALANRPGRPKALELLGDIESQLGNVAEARNAWAGALQVDASDQKTLDAVARQQLFDANQAVKSNNPARAEIVFRRAATLSPSSIEAAEGLARLYSAQQDEARAALWGNEAKKRGAL